MTTEKKIAANRANAMASTGPKSERGKAIARLNAVTHGAFATQRLLPGEDESEYKQLSARVFAETEPKTAIESIVVDQIIADIWRIARIERAQLAFFMRLRESNFANTLLGLSAEEFELAEKMIDNKEQLHTARQQRRNSPLARDAERLRREAAIFAEHRQRSNFGLPGLEDQSSDDTKPRLTSSERETISNIVKRKLEETSELGALLLDAMASENEAAPYTALESMRRTLVRDIVRQYASLVKIQEQRQTIETIEIE